MIEIKQIDNGKKGAFEIYFDGKKAGEMTYTWAGTDKFIIDHTEVDEAYGGKGLAKQLVLAGVDFARKNGKKIIPLCPYAKATFDKNEDLRDVLS
jgi:predicted GNAT family acetyltransferase